MAIIASIIAGLSSVPFTASTVMDDYQPISQTALNMSNTNEITGKLTRSMTSDSFEQSYQTPFGEFVISVHSDIIKQELIRPDRRVIIKETPGLTEWKLVTQNYTLTIQKTGFKQEEKFTSPDGYLKKVKEMGNKTTEVKGDASQVQSSYENAKALMNEELSRMEKIKEKYTRLPMQENVTTTTTIPPENIVINEFMADPEGTDSDPLPDGEWVELYNPGSEVDVEDWTLYDSKDENELHITPSNTNTNDTIISPNSTLLVYRDGDSDFSLNQGGDEIRLFDDTGELIDSYTYSVDQDENVSTGRCPDGGGNWTTFETPTPGSSNNC